jgi:hypothetical protein
VVVVTAAKDVMILFVALLVNVIRATGIVIPMMIVDPACAVLPTGVHYTAVASSMISVFLRTNPTPPILLKSAVLLTARKIVTYSPFFG